MSGDLLLDVLPRRRLPESERGGCMVRPVEKLQLGDDVRTSRYSGHAHPHRGYISPSTMTLCGRERRFLTG